MKNILIICFILSMTFSFANAAHYELTEKVETILLAANTSYANADFIALENTSSIGTCLAWQGLIVLRIKDVSLGDRQIAAAMTSKMGNVPVTVSVDDSVKDPQGYCYLTWISM